MIPGCIPLFLLFRGERYKDPIIRKCVIYVSSLVIYGAFFGGALIYIAGTH